jgi:hypothetical protein
MESESSFKHRPHHFPARVSIGLLGFIGLVFFGPLAWDLLSNNDPPTYWPVLWLLIALYCIILYFLITTRYRISGRDLLIQMGWFNYSTISIDSIRSVEPSSSILSAPAPSLRRLEIKYNQWDSVLVSPRDREGFGKALVSINPNIQIKTPSI